MFHGSMVALVTPMSEEGEIDYPCLSQLVDWHIESGTDAIIAVGTTGESATLTDKEKLAVTRHIVDQAAERIPVIAGTAACSTQHTIDLTFAAMEVGADACLIMTPPYIKPTQEGLYQHYRTIAEKVAVPQIIYNVPNRTASDILPETLERLAEVSNIVGIKEATGSMNRLIDIKNRCGEAIDVYSGDDLTAKDLMLLGGKGVITVTANVVPTMMKHMCDAALAGNTDEANRLHQELLPLHNALFIESNPIPSKWALQQMGKIPGGIRMPMTPLASAHQQVVRSALQQLGL